MFIAAIYASLLKHSRAALLASAFWALPAGLHGATDDAAVDNTNTADVTRCDLSSHGMTVGRGSITRARVSHDGLPCTEIRLQMDVRVNLLFYKFTMRMDESWMVSSNELVAYAWESTENGKRKTIAGELRGDLFAFEIADNGKKSSWSTPRAAYDLAAICPLDKPLALGETRTLRVLDPSTCTIGERLYRNSGVENLKIGDRLVACETVTIDFAGGHLRRWLTTDDWGPLILREDGDQHSGTYSRCASAKN